MRSSKNTDIHIRSPVVRHHESGKTIRQIADIVNLCKSTVYDIIKRSKNGLLKDKKRSGRPRKLKNCEEKFLMREVKSNPGVNSSELVANLQDFNGTIVHPSTIRKIIKRNGYNSRVARRKPLLSAINIKKRYNFAKKYKGKGVDFWKKVIFVDESKFNLFDSDKKQKRVWRKPNMELLKQNMCGTVKHGGKSVMVWGSMGNESTGNLAFIDTTMNKEIYLNLLKTHLKATAEKLNISSDFYFYQDNDPKHTAWDVRMWLLYNCPHVMVTPPQSPDINPIEHLWAFLEKRIRKNRKPENVRELKLILEEEWKLIPQAFVKKLVESMPSRLSEVYKRKGNHTKY